MAVIRLYSLGLTAGCNMKRTPPFEIAASTSEMLPICYSRWWIVQELCSGHLPELHVC